MHIYVYKGESNTGSSINKGNKGSKTKSEVLNSFLKKTHTREINFLYSIYSYIYIYVFTCSFSSFLSTEFLCNVPGIPEDVSQFLPLWSGNELPFYIRLRVYVLEKAKWRLMRTVAVGAAPLLGGFFSSSFFCALRPCNVEVLEGRLSRVANLSACLCLFFSSLSWLQSSFPLSSLLIHIYTCIHIFFVSRITISNLGPVQ